MRRDFGWRGFTFHTIKIFEARTSSDLRPASCVAEVVSVHRYFLTRYAQPPSAHQLPPPPQHHHLHSKEWPPLLRLWRNVAQIDAGWLAGWIAAAPPHRRFLWPTSSRRLFSSASSQCRLWIYGGVTSAAVPLPSPLCARAGRVRGRVRWWWRWWWGQRGCLGAGVALRP